MSERLKKYSPVSVYLMVDNGNAALDFYREVFTAEVTLDILGDWVGPLKKKNKS